MTSLPCVAGAAFVAVLQAVDCRLRGRSHLREARRALLRVACAMPRASACGSSWLSVESRRVALATIATPSRADAPRRRPVCRSREACHSSRGTCHPLGGQTEGQGSTGTSATRLMSESDRASFAAYDVEFVVEISRCRAPLHRSTTQAHRHAADVELYSSTALYISTALQRSTLYILYTLPAVDIQNFPRCPTMLHGGHAARGACGAHFLKCLPLT